MTLRSWAALIAMLILSSLRAALAQERPPNILLILTDDLGYGEVGCYGQKHIRTPTIDALAAAGARFTDAYSGSPVCASSRCTLLTGLHTGHCAIRDNKEIQPEGQEPLPADAVTIARLLKERGYATGAVGKWGLGPLGSDGDPQKQGFDHFFGYICQRHAHSHCPPFLYRNAERVELEGNLAKYASGDEIGPFYAPDLIRDEAVRFITQHRAEPFFLLFATPVPHVALQVPEDSLAEYRGEFEETPYAGDKGYIPHRTPRAAYAAMVTRMDRDIGVLIDLVRELGLEDDTLVIFSSDNGPTWAGGADSPFFESTGGLRGLKGQLYEGGIRVPLIMKWPGRLPAGRVIKTACASWDLFTTIADAAGAPVTHAVDGVSLLPWAMGVGAPPAREHLYWEHPAGGGWQAVRIGNYKGVRRGVKGKPETPLELYDLSADPGETRNIAASHPAVIARMMEIIAARKPSKIPEWNY